MTLICNLFSYVHTQTNNWQMDWMDQISLTPSILVGGVGVGMGKYGDNWDNKGLQYSVFVNSILFVITNTLKGHKSTVQDQCH